MNKKFIITVTVLSVAGYTALFFYSPETNMVERVQEVITLPEPQKSPVERAREEATRIAESQKLILDELQVEEDTILSEKDAVTTAYEMKINELEGRIEEINTVRASF